MPQGKTAGQRCRQLGNDQRCLIFGHPDRPAVCSGLQPSPEMCGDSRRHALAFLGLLERQTRPGGPGT